VIQDIIAGILLVLATEAVTEIIVASEFPIFYWFRKWWATYTFPQGPPKVGFWQHIRVAVYKLFTCGYCFSVWTAAFFAIWTPFDYFDYKCINWIVSLFCIHRLSNWSHILFEIVKRGRVKSYDLTVNIQEIEDAST